MKASDQNRRPVDFLIVTALPEERDAVIKKLGRTRKIQSEGIPTYYLGSVKPYVRKGVYRVAVTMLSHMGNVESAQHTTQVIQHLQPANVFMVGIAAGFKSKVNLGDVLIADQVFYYEEQKQTPSKNELRPRVYEVDSLLLDRAKNYNESVWHELVESERPNESDNTDKPRVHFAPIAVGEKVVADEASASELQGIHAKISGIEMESFGVALAAANAPERPRFLAVRGISDYANSTKNDNWHLYAADVAASFAVGFIKSGPVQTLGYTLSKQPGELSVIAIRHQTMEPLLAHNIENSLPEKLKDGRLKELLIDATDLYHDGRLSTPLEAARRQVDLPKQLARLMRQSQFTEIVYYGIAHIPLVFLAGYQISNKPRVHVLEHNRKKNTWDQLQVGGKYPSIILEGMPNEILSNRGEVVIRISISYPVTEEAMDGIVSAPIASLHLGIAHPKTDVMISESQLSEYSAVFRSMMDEIHNKFPNVTLVHIFYSGPVSLAFSFGRFISKTIHPRVIVYNYSLKDTPAYAWGIEITRNISEPEFLVKA